MKKQFKKTEADTKGITMKHTPGPWRWVGEGILQNDAGDEVTPGNLYDEPDALLIAAAPKLLGALKELQRQLHAHHKMNVKKDFSLMVADAAACTAIAEAEGRK